MSTKDAQRLADCYARSHDYEPPTIRLDSEGNRYVELLQEGEEDSWFNLVFETVEMESGVEEWLSENIDPEHCGQ